MSGQGGTALEPMEKRSRATRTWRHTYNTYTPPARQSHAPVTSTAASAADFKRAAQATVSGAERMIRMYSARCPPARSNLNKTRRPLVSSSSSSVY